MLAIPECWHLVSKPHLFSCQVSDVRVGPTDKHTMHTITGGPEGGTPVVCLPGYGAGAAFFWR